MFFTKQIMTLVVVATLGVLLVLSGCETSNSNYAECFDNDCSAACKTQGFEGGTCDSDICTCISNGETSYPWFNDAGAGEDTDSDDGGSWR